MRSNGVPVRGELGTNAKMDDYEYGLDVKSAKRAAQSNGNIPYLKQGSNIWGNEWEVGSAASGSLVKQIASSGDLLHYKWGKQSILCRVIGRGEAAGAITAGIEPAGVGRREAPNT